MLSSLIFGGLCFALFVIFMIWQFKVLKKYALNCDAVKIDVNKRLITVNGRTIRFIDIETFSVEEAEQPDLAEKYLTKSGFSCYMSDLILVLKDKSTVKCRFNYKGSIYSAIKKLKPYVKTETEIETYNPNSLGSFITGVILIGCILFIIFAGR